MNNDNNKSNIFRSVFNTAQFGLIIEDDKGTIIDVNNAICSLLGAKAEELIGIKVNELTRKYLKVASINLRSLTKDKNTPPIFNLTKSDSKYITLRKVPLSIADKESGHLHTFMEITPQINILEALEKSEADYKLLTNTIKDTILIFDLDKNITYVNDRGPDLLGVPKEEIIGKKLSDFLPEKYHDFLSRRKENLLDNNLENQFVEMAFINKKGEAVDVEISCSPIPGQKNGKSVLIVVRDITYRKALKKQLHKAQRMNAVEKMAGGIAHDFNNLLTIIMGNNELLLNKLKQNQDVAQNLMQIEKACKRAETLTSQLLSFSGQQSLHPQKTNLNELVSSLISLIKQTLRKNINLSAELNPTIGTTLIDSKKLEISIYNLISNAAENMNTEGGKIIIRTNGFCLKNDKQTDHLFTIKAGDYVLLEIKYPGEQIGEEDLNNIFEPFQGKSNLYDNSGLDLPSIYGFVKQSGGYIDINSSAENGITFMLYFPVFVEEEKENLPADDAAAAVKKPNPTILVAEDEYDLNEMICDILEDHGYEVMFALNGKEALDIVKHNPDKIDLVLSDVIMPEMGGPEFVKEAKKINKSLKMIYMSGYTDKAISLIENDDRKFEFLQKPFTPAKLLGKIKTLIQDNKKEDKNSKNKA